MKSFRSRRAISPIFATLILIAIAVIAGIVVYMFTSGFLSGTATGGAGGAQDKVAVQGVDVTAGNVLAQCTAGGPVSITNYIIKDSQTNIVFQAALTTPVTLSTTGTTSGLQEVPVDVTGGGATTTGATYTITLVSSTGGSYVSPSYVAPATAPVTP